MHGLEIPVTDVNRAFRFYAEVLEFPVVSRGDDNSAMFFLGDVHGGMVTLVRADAPPHGEGIRIVLAAEGGLDASRTRLEGLGVTFLGPTDHLPLGLVARFLDSEGNQLALFENLVTARFRSEGRRSNADLVERLDQVRSSLDGALAGLSEAQSLFRTEPREWPILGHLGHIVDALDSCGIITHDLVAGREPPRHLLLETEYPVESLGFARGELARAFADARGWFADVPGEPPAGTLNHGVFGGLDARDWVAFTLFHVGRHVDQVREIRNSAGFPAA